MRLRVQLEQVGADAKVLSATEHRIDAATPLTFGRTPEQNRMPVPDERRMVSSRHGCIELRSDGLWVVDLGSRNGTTLDGVTVDGAGARLTNGAVVGVGDFRLRIEVLADEPVGAETSEGGLGATVVHFDPEHEASEIWESLCQRYAMARDVDVVERRATMLAELRARGANLMPKQLRAVLKRLLVRAGARAAEPEPTGEELLAKAAADALQALAKRLVGDRAPADAKEVRRFTDLMAMFFDLTMQWLAQTMHARSEFEDEFGAEVTMVFDRSNNPLKKQQAAELQKTLLDWSLDREIDTVRGQLEGVYRDLTQHQLGLLVGVKEAIAAVMERLAPDTIEALASKDSKWLSSKGAKAWELYRQIYRDFLEEKSKLFHEVISPAIRRGYLGAHDGSPGAGPA